MAWKELTHWKKGMIIGIIFGVVLGLLDVFLLGTNAEGSRLYFISGNSQLLLLIISFPGFLTALFSRNFVEQYSFWFWFAGIAGLAIFYGIVGTIIGVVIKYYKNKPKLKKRFGKNVKNKRKNRV